MKTGWTAKEEREYAQLRDEFTAAGDSEKQARLRAAQVVNAHRTEDGETRPEAHPDGSDIREHTTARDRITGGARMNKPGGIGTPDIVHAGGVHGHSNRDGGRTGRPAGGR
ncbi:MAG: hypothetical protein JWO69_391 [Thermoleophilia bacterium]|nr:hypothetical protein [Thermoleophilia bacterium]